jgi:VWFA-related protein
VLRYAAFLLLILSSPVLAFAQSNPASSTTIQVTSRIVYVDVVVRDSHGQLVRGLTQQDFRLFEDGKPQQIAYFSARSYDLATARSLPVPPPDGPYTNVPKSDVGGPVNIILFDLANTAQADQQFARMQMLKFLEALPPGRQVALFVLSDRLHLYQSLTGNSSLLIAAAKTINPKDMQLNQSDTDAQRNMDNLDFQRNVLNARDSGENIRLLASLMMQEQQNNAEIRKRLTLTAFAQIARAAAGYPGRKNLFWLSGSFPFSVAMQAQYNLLGPMQFSNFSNPGQPATDLNGTTSAARLIANSQIAVYPISVAGLRAGGVGADVNGIASAAPNGALGTNNGGDSSVSIRHTLSDTLTQQFVNRSNLEVSMNDIAYETGGDAIFNTNDLSDALRQAMEDGSNYYTLAYSPQNATWNGDFRKIKVEVPGHAYSLTYRRGYFAKTGESAPQSPAQALNQALLPSSPESTMLELTSHLKLPDQSNHDLVVYTSVDSSGVRFSDGSQGNHQAKLLVLLVAYNRSTNGKPVTQPKRPPQASGTLDIDAAPPLYQAMLKSGVRFVLKLPLNPGSYVLRLGVTDMNNHRVGTVDMPVTIPASTSGPS